MMDQNKCMSEESKILALITILSKYDFFRIAISDGTEFKCTEISCDEFGCIEFKRQFSTPVYSDRITEIEAISTKEFICESKRKTYVIVPLHNKPIEIPIRENRKLESVIDLFKIDYFGSRFTTYIKELDLLILVVDPYLLGELTRKEHFKIQRMIDVELHGLSRSMQMCRTVCFQVRIHDNRHRVYAGMYDLERGQSVTSKVIFDERTAKYISAELYEAVKKVYSYAESIYRKYDP